MRWTAKSAWLRQVTTAYIGESRTSQWTCNTDQTNDPFVVAADLKRIITDQLVQFENYK